MKYQYMFYIVGLFGILLLTIKPILGLIKKRNEKIKRLSNNKRSKIYLHLKRLMQVLAKSHNADAGKRADIFIFSSIILFFLALAWLFPYFGAIALLLSAGLMCLPYLVLRTKLGTIRYLGSHEGEILVSELLNQYKINYYNMMEAIDKSVPCLDQAPHSQRAMYRLAMRLKIVNSDSDLRDALDDFLFALDTNLGAMLTNNIYMAMKDNLTVVAGLEDILRGCKEITEALERGKRYNLEGFAIAKWLAPTMYVGLMYMAIKSAGFSFQSVLSYQFASSKGIVMIIAITVLAFVNIIIMNMLSAQRYDF